MYMFTERTVAFDMYFKPTSSCLYIITKHISSILHLKLSIYNIYTLILIKLTCNSYKIYCFNYIILLHHIALRYCNRSATILITWCGTVLCAVIITHMYNYVFINFRHHAALHCSAVWRNYCEPGLRVWVEMMSHYQHC